jgi:hypothetical protein
MNLADEITAAQTAARRDGNLDYRDVKGWQVYDKMSEEAKDAYRQTTLPQELLTMPFSKIRDYAERCGISI